ncbi:MAG: hypothetical protein P1V19_08835 [Gimesia sp.]|nr:hypothetical protein [Gimesia sp.]
MIDLAQSQAASPLVHCVKIDPGTAWVKEPRVAIDAPPDDEIDPLPETQWSIESVQSGEPQSVPLRSGVCGVVSPRILTLQGGGYRMYYTQILPRVGFPAGANDYDNATARILSAVSTEGIVWVPEPGVRLSSQEGGAGEFRVASSEVVPTDKTDQLRMYYECCPGPQSTLSTIRSAVSSDGGLEWTPEPGVRLGSSTQRYSSPRILFLEDGRCRLYCLEIGRGIVSALSEDGGLTFQPEPGVRIGQDTPYDSRAAFACEILKVADAGYVMYFAGYSAPNKAHILRASSDDGLTWKKDPEPVLSPDGTGWDAVKCSEMCLIPLPTQVGEPSCFRMFYEACDGTGLDQRGVWRIASATSE